MHRGHHVLDIKTMSLGERLISWKKGDGSQYISVGSNIIMKDRYTVDQNIFLTSPPSLVIGHICMKNKPYTFYCREGIKIKDIKLICFCI